MVQAPQFLRIGNTLVHEGGHTLGSVRAGVDPGALTSMCPLSPPGNGLPSTFVEVAAFPNVFSCASFKLVIVQI